MKSNGSHVTFRKKKKTSRLIIHFEFMGEEEGAKIEGKMEGKKEKIKGKHRIKMEGMRKDQIKLSLSRNDFQKTFG